MPGGTRACTQVRRGQGVPLLRAKPLILSTVCFYATGDFHRSRIPPQTPPPINASSSLVTVPGHYNSKSFIHRDIPLYNNRFVGVSPWFDPHHCPIVPFSFSLRIISERNLPRILPVQVSVHVLANPSQDKRILLSAPIQRGSVTRPRVRDFRSRWWWAMEN